MGRPITDSAPAARPPVLLLHGFGSSFEHGWRRTGWVDLFDDAGREVIGADLLGHGDAPQYHSPDQYGGWDEYAWRPAAGHERVDAIGFSLGGLTLLQLASAHPQHFRRIAVLGVGDLAAGLIDTPVDTVNPVPDLLGILEGNPVDDDPSAAVFRRLVGAEGQDPKALAAVLQRPRRTISAADLARIASPTLLVVGDQDFTGRPTRLAAALPDATTVILPRTDHFATPSSIIAMGEVLDFLSA